MASLPPSHPREADRPDAGRLYVEHADEVFRHCLRQLGSCTEAEDAVQTTFLYALRALDRGEVPRSEIAWLIAIATNVCRWQRRTLARRGPVADGVDVETLAGSGGEHDHDVLMSLPDALASIPERQRHALLLREWRGLPTREVAIQLGMSATATHALLTRARRSLAHALLATQRTLALNLVGFLSQLRGWLAGWLAGAGSKAAVTSVLAVGVAAGSLATQIDASGERAPRPSTPAIATAERGESRAIARHRHMMVTRRLSMAALPTPRALVNARAPARASAVTSPGTGVVPTPALRREALGAPRQVPRAVAAAVAAIQPRTEGAAPERLTKPVVSNLPPPLVEPLPVLPEPLEQLELAEPPHPSELREQAPRVDLVSPAERPDPELDVALPPLLGDGDRPFP